MLNNIGISFRGVFARAALFFSLAGLAAIFAVQPANAGTHVVTNTLDSGAGSLRQVVIDSLPGELIVFDSATFSAPLTITLTSGQILIDKSLTIDGAAGGAYTPTVSGSNASRVFKVLAGNTALLNRLNITAGYVSTSPGGGGIYNQGVLTVTGSVLISNTAAGTQNGGAIYNDANATLFLESSRIITNSAYYGGAVFNGYNASMSISGTAIISNAAQFGGGVANINGGQSVIQASVLTGNYTWNYGGAINNQSPLTIIGSLLAGNSSPYGGGAIQDYAPLNVISSTFIQNTGGSFGGAMNISLGTVFISNSTFVSNTANLRGGAVNNHTQSSLRVAGSTFTDNLVTSGLSYGGGIANDGSSALTVTNSTLISNTASSFGGGIESEGRTSIQGSTVISNYAGGGGGIMLSAPDLTAYVTGTALLNNRATVGAGIALYTGTLSMMNGTLVSNTVSSGGGGLGNFGGTVVAVNSTFAGNRSTATSAGGIYNCSTCAMTLVNATVAGNFSPASYAGGIGNDGTAALTNTIVADNTSANCSGNAFVNSSSNLDSAATCGFDPAGGSISNANPLLGTLGNYGGPVQTLPLLPGSPAIDAATCSGALTPSTDARGVGRPQPAAGACDMGAFESRGFAFGMPAGTPQITDISTTFTVPLAVSVTSAFGEPVDGGLVTFHTPATGASASLLPTSPLAITGGITTTATANGIGGGYVISASASGVSGSVDFNLTNRSPSNILSTATAGSGAGTITPTGGVYGYGTVVTLTATPAVSSTFAGWSSNCAAAGNTCAVTMTADTLVTATFTLNTYSLSTAAAGNGAGSVTPPSGTYGYGTVVTLTATPAVSSTFAGWSSNCAAAGNTCAVTMTADTLVTATFTLNTYALTMAITGSGTVSPGVGAHLYLYGTVVTLTASPQSGWGFVGWDGASPSLGRTNPATVTIDGNLVITATFGAHPVADAGVSRAIRSASTVTLDGSASWANYPPLIFQWQQGGGPAVVLNSTTISQPVFIAPATVTQTQALTFTLVVTDRLGFTSQPAQVVITVAPYPLIMPVILAK